MTNGNGDDDGNDDGNGNGPEGNGGDGQDVPPDRDGRVWVGVTALLCALAAGGGHIWLWADAQGPGGISNGSTSIAGASVALVAAISFGGFFLASLRARVAIAASFVLTFLLILSYTLTLAGFGALNSTSLTESMMGDFRVIVQTIIGFYFGTETVITAAKIIKMPKGTNAKAVMRSDRDLPSSKPKKPSPT
ncbi:MAG TPA: hypothetical protein VEX15_08620 [Nocardioidaceae bacterium]|nr:hypothetical protein [Nocardioidaceae bacterium]